MFHRGGIGTITGIPPPQPLKNKNLKAQGLDLEKGDERRTAPSSAKHAGLAISDLSKSVPFLLLYHETVSELTLKAPLQSHNSRP